MTKVSNRAGFYYLMMTLAGINAIVDGLNHLPAACGVWTLVALFCDWRADSKEHE